MRRPSNPQPEPPTFAPMTLQRRVRIVELIREQGAVRVGDLAAQFDVSEVTIRSDLMQLEKEGQLIRDRGGAIAATTSRQITSLLAVEQRAHLQTDEKSRIAQAAAELVKPGDTILMDAGTTVVKMAQYLAGIPSLTIVTNAVNVALEVAAATDARVILLGGTFHRDSSSIVGAQAEAALGEIIVQKAFLGSQAIDLDHGLTDTTVEIAQAKRAMIRAAREVVVLADSTKWGKVGFMKVAPLTGLDLIISDAALSAENQKVLEQLGVELRLV